MGSFDAWMHLGGAISILVGESPDGNCFCGPEDVRRHLGPVQAKAKYDDATFSSMEACDEGRKVV